MPYSRMTALVVTAILLFLAGPVAADFESEVIGLVNKERRARDLHPLSANEKLTLAAERYSQNMAEKNYFSHTSPDGRSFNERIVAAGYDYRASGENIAAGQPTPAAVVEHWMNSAPHRKNILSPEFCDIGVGYAEVADSRFRHYWTQNFGRRMGVEQCPETAVTPPSSKGHEPESSGIARKE